jgi:hypothetical protein
MIFSTRTVFNGTARVTITGYIAHQLKDLDTPVTPTLPRRYVLQGCATVAFDNIRQTLCDARTTYRLADDIYTPAPSRIRGL